MTQKSTSDALMGNMVLAATLAIVNYGTKKTKDNPLYVTLSGSGEFVTFPLGSESSISLEGDNRLEIRRSSRECALYLDGRRACALELFEDVEIGPLTIRVSTDRHDAEIHGKALVQHIALL